MLESWSDNQSLITSHNTFRHAQQSNTISSPQWEIIFCVSRTENHQNNITRTIMNLLQKFSSVGNTLSYLRFFPSCIASFPCPSFPTPLAIFVYLFFSTQRPSLLEGCEVRFLGEIADRRNWTANWWILFRKLTPQIDLIDVLRWLGVVCALSLAELS